MAINHRISGLFFAFGVGLAFSYFSYQWITNTDRGEQRAIEEGVVLESRKILRSYVSSGEAIHISDPLNRVREAGKVYIYPTQAGWELSGQYQRDGERGWRPFIMHLDSESRLLSLAVRDDDPATIARARNESRFTVNTD